MIDQSSGFDPRTIRRLVSVHYYGRSGSLFLQSLLDGHPDILMFPADYLAGFRIFWDQFGDLAASDLMAAFLGNYEILFDVDSTDKVIGVGQFLGQDYDFAAMGPGRDERLEVDRQDFTVALIRALSFEVDELSSQQVSRKFFFQALHVAYAEVLGRDFQSPDPIIVFQAHNLDVTVIDRLFEDFYPHYRFLHTVREPIQTLASWYQHMFGESASAVLELVEIALGRGLDHAKPILSQLLPLPEAWGWGGRRGRQRHRRLGCREQCRSAPRGPAPGAASHPRAAQPLARHPLARGADA